MTYKFTNVVGGKVVSMSNQDKTALILSVQDIYKKNNITFDKDAVSKAIDRQSRVLSRTQNPGLQKVISGASALIKNLAGSGVSSKEMNRRAGICASCPLHGTIGGCSSCGAAGKVAQWNNALRSKLKLSSQIPSEIKSGFCGICQCSLSLMVVTKISNFYTESDETNLKRPDSCWLKRTSINFTNE